MYTHIYMDIYRYTYTHRYVYICIQDRIPYNAMAATMKGWPDRHRCPFRQAESPGSPVKLDKTTKLDFCVGDTLTKPRRFEQSYAVFFCQR